MIRLVPLEDAIADSAARTATHVGKVFGTTTEVAPLPIECGLAFDRKRGQYNSTRLLEELLKLSPSGQAKVAGITDVDLFIPVLTFVFGEAQLDGTVAIASTHRLRNEFYGLPESPDLVLRRLEKEVVHELGHTFSLTHCENYWCVMHASTFVEDIDLKGADFCPSCRQALEAGGG